MRAKAIMAMIIFMFLALNSKLEMKRTIIDLPEHEVQPVRAYDSTTSGHIGL